MCHVCFSKKWGWNLNCWKEYDMFSGLDLALVAGRNEPPYIAVNSWPPEAVTYSSSSGIKALVT